MTVIDVALEVPDELYTGLLTGDLVCRGGVVRDAAGKIVAHLDEVLVVDGSSEEAAATVAALSKQNKNLVTKGADLTRQNKAILIGIGVASALVVAGGAITYAVNSKKRALQKTKTAQIGESFNTSMMNYLDSIKAGKLSINALSDIINQLETIKINIDEGTLNLELSHNQLDSLVAMIKDYTERLAEANGYTLPEPPASAASDETAKLVLLKHYLDEQRRIAGVK